MRNIPALLIAGFFALPFSSQARADSVQLPNSELSHMIKRTIDSDSSLSPQARKVLVTTLGGKVKITGKVKDADEKLKIESLAEKIAGPRSVSSELKMAD